MTSNSAPISSPKPIYYLGLDLTPDALRGVVIDDTLDVIIADSVLFENSSTGSLTNSGLNPSSSPSASLSPNSNASPNPLLNQNSSQSHPPTPTPSPSSSAPAPTLALSTILAALDALLSKLAARTNLSYVRSISGSTFAGTVFYQSAAFSSSSDSFGGVLSGSADNASDPNAVPSLESLFFSSSSPSATSPSSPSSSPFFALPITPTPTDTSTTPFALLLQDTHYGSASNMAAQCGTSAFAGPVSGLVAAQMIKLRLTMPEVWKNVDAVSGLGAFLVAVLTGGGKPSANVADALASGLLDYASLTAQKSKNEWEWKWNMNTVKFVVDGENASGDQSETEVQRVLNMIGAGEDKEAGSIAGYFSKKYGFGKDTIIHSFTSTHIATYLSLVPTSSDAVISFGTQDAMVMSTPGPSSSPAFTSPPHPSTLTQSFPHPAQTQTQITSSSAQDQGSGSDVSRKWISIITSRNGDVPRMLARDMYTKSWSAFDRLVAIVPPGGSIGLDDKLFSFWFVQPEYESTYITPSNATPPTTTKLLSQSRSSQNHPEGKSARGIYRFENGTKAVEFRDLRANPRCLIEGQIMGFRTRFGRIVAASGSGGATSNNASANGSVLLNGHHTATNTAVASTTPNGHGYTSTPLSSSSPTSSSLPFSPYTSAPLPKRIFATGSASYFPSIVNVVGEVFNCPVFVPQSVLEEGVVWAGLVTALQQGGSSSAGGGGEESNKEEGNVGGDDSSSSSDVGMLNAALARIPSRAGMGAAYLARWGYKRVSGGGAGLNSSSISSSPSAVPPPSTTSFEDDIRWLLAKRWAQAQSVSQYQGYSASGGQQQQQQQANAGLGSGLSGVGLGFGLTLSSSASSPFSSSHGLQTPTSAVSPPGLSGLPSPSPLTSYLSKTPRRGLHRAKSNLALANEIVVEEDEEEEEAANPSGNNGGEGAGDGMSVVLEENEEGVPRESGVYKYPIPTGVNVSSSSSSLLSSSLLPYSPSPANTPGTAPPLASSTTTTAPIPTLSLTTTSLHHQQLSSQQQQPGPLTSLIGPLPTPVPLTSTLHPIAPLTTNDADAQFGLVKVAEPDDDAFVCYASMLFEWVRLESGVWDGIW